MTDTDTIKVSIFQRDDSPVWYMQYRDPETGNKKRRTTGTTNKRDAERMAGKWEAEVIDGRDQTRGRIAWDTFRDRFEQRYLPGLKATTEKKYICVLNVVESFRKPRQLRHITTEFLSQYQQHLRSEGRSENTIKGHLRHVRRFLQWGVDNGYLAAVPKIPKVQRAKNQKLMKGRPLLLEEFERMMSATEKVILTPNAGKAKAKKERPPDARRVPSWQFLLRGLWLSGLRLSESIDLHWTDTDCIRVDMSGKYPMFRVPGEKEKGNTDRILPMTPDFAEFLATVPKNQRHGFVFDPLPQNDGKGRLSAQTVGRTLAAIGESAGIIVDQTAGKPQFASAHDLRRSFGTRWSKRVMPAVLQELMRHASIETTLRYYVDQNADETAAELWAMHAVGTNLGTSKEKGAQPVTETP